MTLVDLVVLAVVALGALRGWRRGGTGLVLSVAGAVVGVIAGGALGEWLAPWSPVSAPATALIVALLGALVGWGAGRRLGEVLARRGDGRPGPRLPGLPDRLLGVAAHAVLTLALLVLAGGVVAATGPAFLSDAAGHSSVLSGAAERLPDPTALLPGGRPTASEVQR